MVFSTPDESSDSIRPSFWVNMVAARVAIKGLIQVGRGRPASCQRLMAIPSSGCGRLVQRQNDCIAAAGGKADGVDDESRALLAGGEVREREAHKDDVACLTYDHKSRRRHCPIRQPVRPFGR